MGASVFRPRAQSNVVRVFVLAAILVFALEIRTVFSLIRLGILTTKKTALVPWAPLERDLSGLARGPGLIAIYPKRRAVQSVWVSRHSSPSG
jgi:hypothetical protein